MGNSSDLMVLAYFWIAQQLDKQKERFSLTGGWATNHGRGHYYCCDQSFELCMLGADQLEFYTSYTQQHYFGDLGGAILDQYLSFSEKNLRRMMQFASVFLMNHMFIKAMS